MQQNNISILSTRPIDGQLVKDAASRNILIDVISFIETRPIDDPVINKQIEIISNQPATVVFTSMNAVDAVTHLLKDHKPGWKIYCIGNTTKKLVEKYFGIGLVVATANNATELAEKIVSGKPTKEIIFFCGDKRRDELPNLLSRHAIKVNEIRLYKTTCLPHKITKPYDGILFFSPSAVVSFFQSNTINELTVLFAIGNTTANEIKKFSTNRIVISDEAEKKKLLEKAIEFFHKDRIHH